MNSGGGGTHWNLKDVKHDWVPDLAVRRAN